MIAPSGARLMLWDDGIENDPGIMALIPRSAVIVNWHYGNEPTFAPYIETIARGGFDQMVAPGARNWNEIFPNVPAALDNERRFIDEGKAARVLGLFQTVWHDDGETLYEATWYPVLYAAAAAWQSRGAVPEAFARDFPSAFFGVDDARYADAVAELGKVLAQFEPAGFAYGQSDALFWADPFDAAAGAQAGSNLSAIRTAGRRRRESLLRAAAAARQRCVGDVPRRATVRRARAQVPNREGSGSDVCRCARSCRIGPDRANRDLMWCKYWMWELRDAYEDLAPLYAQAWRYESRDGHLASNLERYHLAAQRAIERADAIYRVTESYQQTKTLPPFSSVISP